VTRGSRCLATIAVLVAVVATGGAGCGSAEDEGAPSGELPSSQAYLGVCRALLAARNGDAARARTVFENDAHGPLHELSDQVDEENRAIAARLLESKNAVESAVAKNADADAMRTALERLSAATADAVREVEGEPGPCPG
jgi:hypothetical protein